ncbi:hypothetical protein CSAL01_08663 [Colletotrichum salicis]|uniref:Uncharacterized protein n=1 Tax=Colletotrichum salicis TaxID=1209931 RepID=A0A135UG77_9PEZI|nr:hypothetical protein CSAL01_08663 [Colletotrichum salicis]
MTLADLRRLLGATIAIVDIITFHHPDQIHDLDLDPFGKVAQPTEEVPTVWSLSAPAPAPALAPASNTLIDIIEMPSTAFERASFGQAPGPHVLPLPFRQATQGKEGMLRKIGRVLGPLPEPALPRAAQLLLPVAASLRRYYCVAPISSFVSLCLHSVCLSTTHAKPTVNPPLALAPLPS